MRKMILGISAILLLAGTAISEEITYALNGAIVNSGYDKKASVSFVYHGHYWIKFKDLKNSLNFNLNLNLNKYVSIMPLGLQMNLEKSFDDYTGGKGYSYNNVVWRPGVYFHVPVSQFFVGGSVYLHNEFNLKVKTDSGTKIDAEQVYRPYFGLSAFIAKDLGMIQPLVGYNYDGHINFDGIFSGYYSKHMIFAALNVKLVNNLIVISPEYRLRIFPDARYHKAENIVGLNLGLNIH